MIVFGVNRTLEELLERKLVADFLKRFKSLMQAERFSFAERKGLVETLAWLGLTFVQAKQIILELALSNYSSGVGCKTKNKSEELCVFGIDIDDQPLYVKLLLDNNKNRAICMSFHIAKWEVPLKYDDETEHEGDET
jgi:hypothetical protein